MKALLADNDLFARRLLASQMTQCGYDVATAADGNEAWQVLRSRDAPRLAVLACNLSGVDGPSLCRRVRRHDGHRYTYVLLVAVQEDERSVAEAMAAGADDYITKPLRPSELRMRLRTARRILERVSTLVAECDTLHRKADHDALTGLLNHSAILCALEREVSRAARQGTPLAALMADVVHFKAINDSHGHPIGDAVLREIAQRMREATRPYDSLGRYGGDEFLVLLPGCAVRSAIQQAERIRVFVAAKAVTSSASPIPVTISVGAAVCDTRAPCAPGVLIEAADQALYRAKREGGNRGRLGGFHWSLSANPVVDVQSSSMPVQERHAMKSYDFY